MIGLITDREQENVLYRNKLATKGFSNMTADEQAEWLGDPMNTEGANLFSPGPYYSSAVTLRYLNDAIVANASQAGTYLYAISILGEAEKFAGQTLTLSVDSIRVLGGGKPQIALWWHDDSGYEFAGASMTESGSITFTVSENTGNRANLAAYIYVTTDASVEAGASVRFNGVMLEKGSTRHEYVPYTEVIPTTATKGAYNYSDLNRVERAVAEIAETLGISLATKTNWAMWDVPRSSDMERYLYNIKVLRNAISSDIELPENMNRLTYDVANNLESILVAIYEDMQHSVQCAEVFCGEV